MRDDWTQRYLAFLGIEHPEPSLEDLNRLVGAHRRVVFENLTSLVRRRNTPEGPVPALDTDALLESWEHGRSGGVCFEITAMLSRLLRSIGYDAQPVLAEISFPWSHQAIVVKLDGSRYLVDSGNGAPFYEAIPLDGEPFELRRAGLAYRFRIDPALGKAVQDRWIEEKWQPFVRYDLMASTPAQREDAYQQHHVPGAPSFVVNTFRLVGFEEQRLFQLANHQFTTYTGAGKSSDEVYGLQRYRELVADVFRLPRAPVQQALETWSKLTGEKI